MMNSAVLVWVRIPEQIAKHRIYVDKQMERRSFTIDMVSKFDEFCIKNKELCIKNKNCALKTRNFVLKMMNSADVQRH